MRERNMVMFTYIFRLIGVTRRLKTWERVCFSFFSFPAQVVYVKILLTIQSFKFFATNRIFNYFYEICNIQISLSTSTYNLQI